jgi:hypothetical protein
MSHWNFGPNLNSKHNTIFELSLEEVPTLVEFLLIDSIGSWKLLLYIRLGNSKFKF